MPRSGRLHLDTPAPMAARRPQRQIWHGQVLDDDYAWLRDPAYPQVADADVLAYLHAENSYFEAALAPHRPLVSALYKELVMSRKMTDREFHDAVIQGGPMPIAMVRARLLKVPLTREGAAPWRFADDLPSPRPFPVTKGK